MGRHVAPLPPCPRCQGRGFIHEPLPPATLADLLADTYSAWQRCPRCLGDGILWREV